MNSVCKTLVMTCDPDMAQRVTGTLGKSPAFSTNGTCRSVAELAAALQRTEAPAAVVDIDPATRGVLAELEKLSARFPRTRFVVLSDESSQDLLLAAMQAGARHLLRKDAVEQDLADVLGRLIQSDAAETPRGAIVTVLSASGGCGATTLAVNLAWELYERSGEATLLVDLDTAYGGAGACLGLEGTYGTADVLARNDGIDPELIASTSVQWHENLSVLLSPAGTDFSTSRAVDWSRMDMAMEACAVGNRFTVIDAPRVEMDQAACLAGHSLAVLLVFQLNVKDIRIASKAVAALIERGISGERIVPLANRFETRHNMVRLADAQRALGSVRVSTLRNEFRSAIRGLNFGQPLSQAAPRSHLRRDFQDLAGELHRQSEQVRLATARQS